MLLVAVLDSRNNLQEIYRFLDQLTKLNQYYSSDTFLSSTHIMELPNQQKITAISSIVIEYWKKVYICIVARKLWWIKLVFSNIIEQHFEFIKPSVYLQLCFFYSSHMENHRKDEHLDNEVIFCISNVKFEDSRGFWHCVLPSTLIEDIWFDDLEF